MLLLYDLQMCSRKRLKIKVPELISYSGTLKKQKFLSEM